MSVQEASECAVSVVSLYGELLKLCDGDQSLRALDGQDADVVPPFLVKSN